jgi:hypothetical protein
MSDALAILGVLALYFVVVNFIPFLACGFSGCWTGTESYSPMWGQLGLLVCGLLLVAVAFVVLGRGRSASLRLVAAAVALVLGSGTAMGHVGIGPNGCPWGETLAQSQTGSGLNSITCSGDMWAKPSR